MKNFAVLFLIITACSTSQVKKPPVDVQTFFQTDLTTTSALVVSKFGRPSAVESELIAGKNFEFWTYSGGSGSFIELLIDLADQTVVEKRFFTGEAKAISLTQLKASNLQNVELQKIAVKCRHNDELALVNEEAGIVILTKDNGNSLKVQLIAQSTPQLYAYWLNENSNRKCPY